MKKIFLTFLILGFTFSTLSNSKCLSPITINPYAINWPKELGKIDTNIIDEISRFREYFIQIWKIAKDFESFEIWSYSDLYKKAKKEYFKIVFYHSFGNNVQGMISCLKLASVKTDRYALTELKKNLLRFSSNLTIWKEITDEKKFSAILSKIPNTDSEKKPIPYIYRMLYVAKKAFYNGDVKSKLQLQKFKQVVIKLEECANRIKLYCIIIEKEIENKKHKNKELKKST